MQIDYFLLVLYNKSMSYWKLLLVIFVAQVAQINAEGPTHRNFLQWKEQHGKAYADQTQQLYRFYIYSQNVQRIKKVNSKPELTYKLGVNKFSDLTWEEFKHIYLTVLPPPKPHVGEDNDSQNRVRGNGVKNDNLRQEVEDDNKTRPHVGNDSCVFNLDYSVVNPQLNNQYPHPVQDQGACGSCYAFAGIAALGAAASIQKNISYISSPQQIVDCTNNDDFGNNGCNGGWFDGAYLYGQTTNIATAADYPYTANAQTCQNATTTRGPIRIANYTSTDGQNDDEKCSAIANKLKTAPLAVAVAVNSNFSSYQSGVLPQSACPSDQVNHGVYLVGVDTCGNWKIQNSWGTNWGNNGLIVIQAGNTCNICTNGGYFPTLA